MKVFYIKIFPLILLTFVLFIIQTGCSDDGTASYPTPVPTQTPASSYPGPEEVLNHYFTAEQVAEMKADAEPIIAQYDGLNIFSTCHYGRKFITGTANIKDVFDARIPVNQEIFEKYAWDNFGSKGAFYERFAEAANAFIEEFEYDAVLFYPDELHPVFTDPTHDTWMILRDAPTNEYDIYYSSRVVNREIAVTGGLKMTPLTPEDDLGISNWVYYIPAEGSDYIAFTEGDIAIANIPRISIGPSNYVPQDASQGAINRRNLYGIIPSDLSNRQIKVGGWKNELYIEDMITNGISFTNDPNSGTWGGWGLYLLPLEKEFWD